MAPILLEVEPEYQGLAEAFSALVDQLKQRRQAAHAGERIPYAELEREVAQGVGAIERAAHATLLLALDVDAPQVLIEGKAHRRVLRTAGTYYTMAGPVQVMRTLYRPVGARRAATVDAVSVRAGVVGEGWLPLCAQAMAWECQRAPSREAEAASERWLRLPYSRSAFERVMHLCGAQYGQQREEVERELVETMEIPKEAHSVSVSLDRVSIPMEEPREAPQRSPEKAPERSPKRKAPKRYIQRVFRMAYAATVTLHDATGKSLCTLRYGRMPQGDIDGLCTALCDDVLWLLRRRPELHVLLLCDGARELWNRLGEEFTESSIGRPVHRLVDLWHLLEKLGSAAKVLCGEEGVTAQLGAWRLSLLNQDEAVEQIEQTLRRSGKESVRVGDSRPVHEALTYLANHREDMRYKKARALGGLGQRGGDVQEPLRRAPQAPRLPLQDRLGRPLGRPSRPGPERPLRAGPDARPVPSTQTRHRPFLSPDQTLLRRMRSTPLAEPAPSAACCLCSKCFEVGGCNAGRSNEELLWEKMW